MMLAVDSDQGVVTIGSPPVRLPGILESVDVDGSLIVESASMQGRSGTTRTVHGWNDSNVAINLSLVDDPGAGKTRFDQLAQIVAVFKTVTSTGGPEVYTLGHPALAAWGIRQMLFSDLKTSESRGKRKLSVALEFVEHESTVGSSQERHEIVERVDAAANDEEEAIAVSDVAAMRLSLQERRFGNV